MPGDAGRERIERAGLDQALEHALVEQPQVEILAERVQRRDASLLRAHLEQRLDRALADVLDRGQAEAHAFVFDREAQLALVDVRRQHRNAALAASPRYIASLSVFCASIVNSAAAKCHG